MPFTRKKTSLIYVVYCCLLISLGICLLLRILRYYEYRKTIRDGVKLTVIKGLWEPIEQSGYKYIIKENGLRMECNRANIECEVLDQIEVGSRVVVSGVIKNRVINDEYTQIKLMVSEISLIAEKPSVLVRVLVGVLKLVYELREKIDIIYRTSIPVEEANLLRGIVLGKAGSWDKGLYESMQKTGIMHVVAASGFNVNFAVAMFYSLGIRLWGRKKAVGFALLGLVTYTIIAGSSAAILRASIMSAIMLLSQRWGKAYYGIWALVLTAIVMIGLRPWILEDISFWLSVSATMGMMFGVDKVSNFITYTISKVGVDINFVKNSVLKVIYESLLRDGGATIAATIVTFPIIINSFGMISVVALVVNMLVLWVVPPVMILGSASALLGLIWYPLGQAGCFICWPFLRYFLEVVKIFGNLPFASISYEGEWNVWLSIGWWILVFAWWGRRDRRC